MKVKIKIGGVDYTKYVEVPFQDKSVLDESLDMASIRLFYTDKKEEFKPFTLVELEVEDDIKKTLKMYIASDVTEEVLSTGKVNHTLVLIEETKSIERLLLTKTTTNPLVKDFTDAQMPIVPIIEGINNGVVVPENYVSPIKQGNFTIQSVRTIAGIDYVGLPLMQYTMELISPLGEQLIAIRDADEIITYNFNKNGQYRIIYRWTGGGGVGYSDKKATFYINVVSAQEKAVNKTITYVVNTLLESCETIRRGDNPKFIFNSEQAEFYRNVNCPEMTFTKQTLWEALRQIGGYIHAIPRVKDNEIYFDSYDSIVYSDIAKKKPISNTGSFDIEQFCSTLESSVDNLIQADNSSQGAIIDFGGYFKTTRTEQLNAQITEDNMFIETVQNIGKVISVEVGYLPDGTYVGDISNYVYERSEYDALSSYDETYPTSKALAIYYTLGQKHIKGLSFTVASAFSDVFHDPAIANIINHKLGKDISWWNSLWSGLDTMNLQFRVTYQPYYSATLRQVKPNLKDLKFKSVLSYTQGANSISTQAYGENLKGAVARLGTAEKRKTYILKHLSEIPKVGDKFDKDYRISEVNCEYYKDYIICEIGLSKKFNRWNEFVGVDNELRMYEVSEKQVAERPVIWEDYAVIQKKQEKIEQGSSFITSNGSDFLAFSDTFLNIGGTTNIKSVESATFDEEGTLISKYWMPALCFAVGNTFQVEFEYIDNFSAGTYAHTDNKGTKTQTYAQYSNYLGEAKYLRVRFYNDTYIPESYKNYEQFVKTGDNLPQIPKTLTALPVLNSNENGDLLILNKDNREKIKFVYCLHFVANEDDLIIGSALAKLNPLAYGYEKNSEIKPSVYILNRKIKDFENVMDLREAILQEAQPQIKGTTHKITFGLKDNETMIADGKSWVVVIKNPYNKEEDLLLFGKNVEFKQGDLASEVWADYEIAFTHNVDEYL